MGKAWGKEMLWNSEERVAGSQNQGTKTRCALSQDTNLRFMWFWGKRKVSLLTSDPRDGLLLKPLLGWVAASTLTDPCKKWSAGRKPQSQEKALKINFGENAKHWPNITWIDCLPNFEYFPWLVMYFRSLNPKSILPTLSGWLKFKISSYHARGRCSKTEIRIQIKQSEFWHLDLNICVCTKQIFCECHLHISWT